MVETSAWSVRNVFAEGPSATGDIPIYFVRTADAGQLAGFDDHQKAWLAAQRFSGSAKRHVLVPGAGGKVDAVVLGLGDGQQGEPSGPSELLAGLLSGSLPSATYRYASELSDSYLAEVAWALGSYSFSRYKRRDNASERARLRLETPDAARVINTAEAVWFARDLINTPASDLGPAEIEAAARLLAERHGADISVVMGDELLAQNYPMIHAVGRGSPRQPRLIDLSWEPTGAPKITLVGKGITFDTGGLDIKPANAMLLMKKDMGGAATALALAHMIMGQGLKCRLRVLIPTAENSISGDAFRPGDVLASRAGFSVEIGNTDAEGRLVLADALALADSEEPDSIFVFATLTGAARSALGPDLPAFFTDDEALAQGLPTLAASIGDPLWRLPLWEGYRRHLDSDIADINNVWESPFAGAITAALFLKRFVNKARRFAHFDLYGWRSAPRPLGPKGGEPQTARAVMEYLRRELAA
ncbi:leucyl aminopeptidase family protein [Hyphomicrobium sp.]|jgi:leucyl aminopeptidase|uniref:leucyl aminopeptidase family protein n=1 Tax=Hyphomicrobium sp. TaxID=82 RepID=UPI002CEB426B|nr:leucyl aminopeptidase family protein [Hyphomicrobium sp.]HVZ03259.1 leucyl aminopeptidase family protein [Hyphomicrobium sp.]